MKQTIFTAILIFAFCFAAFAQSDENQLDESRITKLVLKVQAKSRRNRAAYLSEYERTFKVTIESEAKNKTSSQTFEQYCLNDGKPYCGNIEIQRNGKSHSLSKIKKEREKVAKNLINNEDFVFKGDDLLGYGMSVSLAYIEPTLYLKVCRIVSSSEKQIQGRTAIVLRVDDCNLNEAYSKWKNSLNFMPKTKADILIDEEDESVIRMDVYAKEEFSPATAQNKPVITLENIRMPEGFWLFKKIRLETIGNKAIFPNLKDNWQFDYYGYRKYEITVKQTELNLPK